MSEQPSEQPQRCPICGSELRNWRGKPACWNNYCGIKKEVKTLNKIRLHVKGVKRRFF